MEFKEITPVPNSIFDVHLSKLSPSVIMVLLVIIRGTYGWVNKVTGKRKERDRITAGQFMKKTGLAKRTISSAIQTLLEKGLISVTNYPGKDLSTPLSRKGKSYIYYAFQPMQKTTSSSAKNNDIPVQITTYNKKNIKKENNTKENCMVHIETFLSRN
ncbi:MAG: hypothetical protein POELPBGB_01309 [Bacteroidia bacterium]|nr:hypothetical protein [Bacteroidia bacterium]